MKKFLSILFAAFYATGFSQDNRCGTPLPHYFPVEILPATIQNRSVITIPVVFHIVWKDSSENIADQRIYEQLDVLNTDFRALNSSLKYLSVKKQQLAADMEIEFCLAAEDPDGKPTTGINRLKTDVDNIGTQNTASIPSKAFIKHTSLGGADAWDTDRYLNIWVGRFQQGAILAESKFPWDMQPAEDGIRIDPDYVGINCTAAPKKQFALGRTLTHEVGHYLGLLHPWSADCAVGDYVDDTPAQRSPYYGCMPNVDDDACGQVPLVENFMQFSDDNCLAMFTQGQKQRVYQMLGQYRPILGSGNVPCANTTFTEPLTEADIKIYPNPAHGCVMMQLNADRSQEVNIEIFDATGKLIDSDRHKILTVRPVELKYLQSGMYFIRISSLGSSFIRKIIVL